MTVLYIIDPGTVGGATHSFMEVISLMKKLGVTPIVCTGVQNQLNDELNNAGILNICIGHETVLKPLVRNGFKWPARYLVNLLKYKKSLRRALKIVDDQIDFTRIDLIHTNSARNDIGCYMKKKYKVPHLMHIREFADKDFGCVSFDYKYIDRYNKYVDRFITISEAVKKHWIQKGIDGKRMTTIYNGIHFDDIIPSEDIEKKSSDLKMVIVGGVGAPKGQLDIVKAMALLPIEIRKHVFLDIIGWYDRRYVSEIQKVMACNNLVSHINILGARNDVHDILHQYQIGLNCSVCEGFGRSTAEYMHARLGVIASDTGANTELIEHNHSGLIYKSGEIDQLSECIVNFYLNRDILIEFSHNAFIKARREYTDKLNASSIYKIYTSMVSNMIN